MATFGTVYTVYNVCVCACGSDCMTRNVYFGPPAYLPEISTDVS